MRDFDNSALDFFRMIATIQVFGGHIITHLVPSPPPGWNFMEYYLFYPWCTHFVRPLRVPGCKVSGTSRS